MTDHGDGRGGDTNEKLRDLEGSLNSCKKLGAQAGALRVFGLAALASFSFSNLLVSY